MTRRVRWTAGFLGVGALSALLMARAALAVDCGNEPVPCGPPNVHTCHCGDTVRWNYTLSGALTNSGSGTAPCTTSVGLVMASGVTLTGDGTASVSGSGGSGSVGIKFDNVSASKVTSSSGYLQVSGFERGVQLQNNAANNTVESVESHHNDNGGTNKSGSYGIDLRTGATANLVQNVWVHHNADEGIHLGGGSFSNTVTNGLFECNAVEQMYLVESDTNTITNNTAISGNNTPSVCSGAINNATLKVHNADGNTFKGNTFENKLIIVTAGAHDNVFGTATAGEGNSLSGGRLEFQQGQDTVGTWLAAYNNKVTNMTISGPTTGCVNFKKHADSPDSVVLPSGNRVNGSVLNCTGTTKEIIALSDNGPGTPNGDNFVCNSSCNGATCTNNDATDQLGIIDVQSAACP